MNYRWNIHAQSKAKTIQDVLRNVIAWKDIPKEKIREFIDFQITPPSPFLLTNMEKAIQRIKKAIYNNEKICVIGDYDADGVTGTSVMYIGLRSVFTNVIWKIPDRFKDGYGVNKRLIDLAHEEGCKLIITVDNGIAAHEPIEYAKSLGLDVIVTDHHQMQKSGIPTEITVNPQIDDAYPFKSICGCMVAFKVILALIPDLETKNNKLFKELVGITTIGTIADMMEIVEENRYWVKMGLQFLSDTTNAGLRCLLDKLKLLGKDITTTDIGFAVGPCINAAGRLESPDIAANLILCDDNVEGSKLADKLLKLNDKRKDMQHEILEKLEINEDDKFIIVHFDDIGHGLLGIVAGQIAEKYKRPCFVLSGNEKKGTLSGSGRSVYTYNIFKVVENNRDIASGGGHAGACGVEIPFEALEEFKKRCCKDFEKWMETATEEDLIPAIDVACEIGLDIISERLINNLGKLQPYGTGNEEPLFVTKGLEVEDAKVVGKNKSTIQLKLNQGFKNIKAVGFKNAKEAYEELGNPLKVDIVYTLAMNEWPTGIYTPQLIIKDIKVTE